MNTSPRLPFWLPVATLLLAMLHLSIEHVTGGIKSHHLLNSADLPAISNWYELLTLPLLGVILAMSCQRQPVTAPRWAGVPHSVWPGLIGAAMYGAVLATSFALGAMVITEAAFFALFFCAVVFKLYRAQFIVGFVLAMTFTFGGILPLLIAMVFAVLSLIVHRCFAVALKIWRRRQKASALV